MTWTSSWALGLELRRAVQKWVLYHKPLVSKFCSQSVRLTVQEVGCHEKASYLMVPQEVTLLFGEQALSSRASLLVSHEGPTVKAGSLLWLSYRDPRGQRVRRDWPQMSEGSDSSSCSLGCRCTHYSHGRAASCCRKTEAQSLHKLMG